MTIGYEHINLDVLPEETPPQETTIEGVTDGILPAGEATVLSDKIDPDTLIERANASLQQVGKRRKDCVDEATTLRVTGSNAAAGTGTLFSAAILAGPELNATIGFYASIAGVMVETVSWSRNFFGYATSSTATPHGKYRIQALYGNYPTSKTKKGDTLLMVHPPTQKPNGTDVTYDSQYSLLLDALTHTDADTFILPLPEGESGKDAVPLRQLTKQLKGVSCKLPYDEAVQARLLTRQELTDLVAEGEAARLPALLRQRVSQLYPSAASVLRRKPDIPKDASEEERIRIENWHRQQRKSILERLLKAEFQSSNDDVARERSRGEGPEKSDLEKNVPTVPISASETNEENTIKADYATKYVKQHLTAVTIQGDLAFADGQNMVSDKRSIAGIAPLLRDKQALKGIRDGVKADDYTPIELLSLAWQAEDLEQELPRLDDDEPTQHEATLHLRPPITLRRYREAFKSRPEAVRFAKRLGVAALAGTALWLLPSAGGSAVPSPPPQAPLSFHVEAHGNVDLTGYYAQTTQYDLRGDTMQWTLNGPDAQEGTTYATVPAPFVKDYLKVDQIYLDDYPFAQWFTPTKEGYYLTAVDATDEHGKQIPVKIVHTNDGLSMVEIPENKKDVDVKLTTYLAPEPGSGIVHPDRPLTISGPYVPQSNKSLQPSVPLGQLSDLMKFYGVQYDSTPGKLGQAIKDTNVGNLADHVLWGPARYANCDVTANLGAMDQVLNNPTQNTARVGGYLISKDTDRQGEEYVVDGHAWLAQNNDANPMASTIIDETPPIPPGLTKKDVGLNDTPQADLAAEWKRIESQFTPKDERTEASQPFPWQPLTAFGALTLAVAASTGKRRQWLQLQGGRTIDKVREFFPTNEVTPEAFRNLVAEQVYGDPNGEKTIDTEQFDDMRSRIFTYQGVTDDSLPDYVLRQIVNRESPIIKALLTTPERRAARNHAKRILHKRQHEAHRINRVARKAAKNGQSSELTNGIEKLH